MFVWPKMGYVQAKIGLTTQFDQHQPGNYLKPCTVLYCIVLYCIVSYCIVLYCMPLILYCFLLSNCSKYHQNNSTNIQQYFTVICTVENLFAIQSLQLSHSPSFIDKFIDYSSWIINLLLDILVCI